VSVPPNADTETHLRQFRQYLAKFYQNCASWDRRKLLSVSAQSILSVCIVLWLTWLRTMTTAGFSQTEA